TASFKEDQLAASVVSALLRALLYAKKDDPVCEGWWREITFHRLRSVSDPDDPVIERLLAWLHESKEVTWSAVVPYLNSKGKGNAVTWLAALKGKLEGRRKDTAANLEKILNAFDKALQKIAEPSGGNKDKVSLSNIRTAERLRERIAALPKPEA